MIVAVVALLVSVASAVFARRQAVETRRLREIEQRRHHGERRPSFNLEVEAVNDGQWHRLWVILTTPEALDSLEVTILDPQLIWFRSGQRGVEPGLDRKVAAWGSVEPGVRTVAWRIASEDDDGHCVRLGIRATQGAESWSLQEEVELPAKPYDLMQSVY